MSRLVCFVLGVVTTCAVLLAITLPVILGSHGFSAREQPGAMEAWLARSARRMAASDCGAGSAANPIPNTPEVLAEARAHWADHCASCHANDGSGESLMGKRTYPPAPDMRLPATQSMSDLQLFCIIQNGVRMTAMPAWGGSGDHDAEDSWKLVHFIRHLPQLSAEEKKEMEKLNPKGPEDLKEEQEEEKFLRGDSDDQPSNPSPEHHHH